MSDRLTLWANLTSAARAFATTDDKESCAAHAFAALLSFGRDKGKRLSEVKDLSWYRQALENSVNDPSKARFKASNEAELAAVDAELEGRA